MGPAADDSDFAMERTRRISLYFNGRYFDHTPDTVLTSFMTGDIYDHKSTSATFNPRLWIISVRLFSRPWRSRIWVVQEATAQTATVFMCGVHSLNWDDIQFASCAIRDLENKFEYEKLPDMPPPSEMTNLWHFSDILDFKPWLLRVLNRLRSFGASDPRDKAFAPLGLASDVVIENRL